MSQSMNLYNYHHMNFYNYHCKCFCMIPSNQNMTQKH